eukprot:gene883-7902_t
MPVSVVLFIIDILFVRISCAAFRQFDLQEPAVSFETEGVVDGRFRNISFPVDSAGNLVLVAIRANQFPVPSNTLVSHCRIVFPTWRSGSSNNISTVFIRIAIRNNSSQLTTGANDISRRESSPMLHAELLPEVTEWEIGPWDDNSQEKSPQLLNMVQRVVDAENWEHNEAVIFIMQPETSPESPPSPRKFSNERNRRPSLEISYIALNTDAPGQSGINAFVELMGTADGVAIVILLYAYAGTIILLLACSRHLRKKTVKSRKLSFKKRRVSRGSTLSILSTAPDVTAEHPLFQWELPPAALAIRQEIGRGRFGRVYAATAHAIKDIGTVEAAVKMLGADEGSQEHSIFFDAAYTMHTFCQTDHSNVLKLIGVVTKTYPYMIVTELCECGSFQDVLLKAKRADSRTSPQNVLLLSERVKLLADISRGMSFLSNQGFVHRFLAAKNCLVDGYMTAKVGGFDSSHWVVGRAEDYATGLGSYPVRWLSPQTLADGRYSTKSDVWTFGICIWEAVTFCDKPYSEFPDDQACLENIMLGMRMDKPVSCPDSLFSIMRQCWHMGPNSRPDFEILLGSLTVVPRRVSVYSILVKPLVRLPGMISLGGGMPNPSLFPITGLSFHIKGFSDAIALTPEELSTALQYSPTPGLPRLTAWLKQIIAIDHSLDENRCEQMNLCVTTGSQEAFSRAAEMLLDPGKSSILVESPTYSGALAALYPMRVNIVKVSSDDNGLDADVLERILKAWPAEKGDRPRVLYTIPNGCNPTGASMSLERRHLIYDICRKYDVIILEDDPYYYLQFSSPRLPSLFSLDTDGRVLRFDSFSKIVSSGLRLGFVTGPSQLINQLQLHGQAVSLHTSGISQALLLKLLDFWGLHGFHNHVDEVVAFYEKQKEIFLHAANEHLSGLADWNHNIQAGMFSWLQTSVNDTKVANYLICIDLWISFPSSREIDVCPYTSKKLIEEKAVEAKVLFVPGSAFFAPDTDLRTGSNHVPVKTPYVRAAFSTATEEEMNEALQRLAVLLRQHPQ